MDSPTPSAAEMVERLNARCEMLEAARDDAEHREVIQRGARSVADACAKMMDGIAKDRAEKIQSLESDLASARRCQAEAEAELETLKGENTRLTRLATKFRDRCDRMLQDHYRDGKLSEQSESLSHVLLSETFQEFGEQVYDA